MKDYTTYNHRTLKAALLSTLAIGAMLPASAAFAQDEAANADDNGGAIIVTAQRREQSIQDVPIAISAFDPQTLETLAVKKTIDLVDTIPNLVGSNNTSLGSANVYFLRGQGQDESFPTFDPAVGTYVDEIFYARQNGNNISLFDIERTEVLRGPQGTLFGKNTTGGAINIVLRKPGEELGGFVEASYGKFDEVSVRGSIDLPASDTARFMVSGFYIDDNGWLKNTRLGRNFNDRNAFGARIAGDIDITPDLNWYIAADYINDSGTNITGIDAIADDNDNVTGRYGKVRLETTSVLPGGLGAVYDGAESKADYGSETISYNVSSNLGYQTSNGAINLILGYRKVENDFLVNFPLPTVGFFLPSSPDDVFIIDNLGDFKQYSAELKYNASLFDDFLNLTTGIFYMKEENRSDFAAYFAGPTPSRDRIISNDTENIAGYIQGDLALTEQLTVTAGVRYTEESKTFDVSDNRPVGDDANTPTDQLTDLTTENLIRLGIPTRQKAKVWTPRFAVQFEPNDDLMFYGSATRGFRSGGWNARQNNVAGLQPFGKETVWSYEVGSRADFGRALSLAVTAFYLEAKDLQINTTIGQGLFAIGNAGALQNKGVEIEAFIRPAAGFNLYASLGLMDAEYKASDEDAAACVTPNTRFGSLDANCDPATVKRTPEIQTTFGGSYAFDLGDATITPRASIRMVSDQVTTSQGRGPSDGYTLINAGVDVQPFGENLKLSVECSNCFDKRYAVATFGNGDIYFNNPGRWTLRARYNFGGRAR